MTTDLPAISLFSNCGAGDLGFARAGFEFEVLAELDPRRLAVASLNLPRAATVAGDLRKTWRCVVNAYQERRDVDPPALLAACPPCQGMSSARSGRGPEADADAGSKDDRNLLVDVIARVALALQPRVVVVENVQAFLTRRVRHPRSGVPISAAALLARSLCRDYTLWPLLADLADFGVPQTRKRAFLCFVRKLDPAADALQLAARAPFPRPTHTPEAGTSAVTLREALVSLGASTLDAAHAGAAGSGMHSVPVWDATVYRMVATIPPDSGQGAWANSVCLSCGNSAAADDDAICRCCGERLPRPVVVTDTGDLRLVRGFRTSSYTRMHPDRPASTVTTASGHLGSDRTVHPWENRVLSPLECAHLQTFPQDFQWGTALADWGHTNVRAMIGEAVPPGFTQQHGDVLAGFLTGTASRAALANSDQRIVRATRRLREAERHARAAAKALP